MIYYQLQQTLCLLAQATKLALPPLLIARTTSSYCDVCLATHIAYASAGARASSPPMPEFSAIPTSRPSVSSFTRGLDQIDVFKFLNGGHGGESLIQLSTTLISCGIHTLSLPVANLATAETRLDIFPSSNLPGSRWWRNALKYQLLLFLDGADTSAKLFATALATISCLPRLRKPLDCLALFASAIFFTRRLVIGDDSASATELGDIAQPDFQEYRQAANLVPLASLMPTQPDDAA